MKASILKSLSESLALALLLEASGYPKPGNVHRTRDRKGLRYEAFLATGIFSLKYFEKGLKRGCRGEYGKLVFGDLIYGLVKNVIDKLKSTNTCLGSSLLLSLMSVSLGNYICSEYGELEDLIELSKNILKSTTVWDTIYYYMAIRKASPSYIKPGDVTGEYINVWDRKYRKHLIEKNHALIDVLNYSSRFDIIAREALNGFKQGFKAEEFLRNRIEFHGEVNRAIVETYLYLLSLNKDTIIVLKHGDKEAIKVSRKAGKVLKQVLNAGDNWKKHVLLFDKTLHDKGINPGAVADLTVETLALYLVRNTINRSVLLDLSH